MQPPGGEYPCGSIPSTKWDRIEGKFRAPSWARHRNHREGSTPAGPSPTPSRTVLKENFARPRRHDAVTTGREYPCGSIPSTKWDRIEGKICAPSWARRRNHVLPQPALCNRPQLRLQVRRAGVFRVAFQVVFHVPRLNGQGIDPRGWPKSEGIIPCYPLIPLEKKTMAMRVLLLAKKATACLT